jgi:hypothetical protein
MSLSEVYIKESIVKKDVPVSEALEKYLPLFSENAVYWLLATDRTVFEPLSSLEKNLAGVYSLTVCDDLRELRLEKGPFESKGRYRFIEELDSGETDGARPVYCRTSGYVLRRKIAAKRSPRAVIDYPGSSAKLVYKEYFSPNEGGWLTLTAARLAGLAQ